MKLGLGGQRRVRELLAESVQLRHGLGELAILVFHDAEEEGGAGDVVGQRTTHQLFEASLLLRIVLEAVGLLEFLGGGLLPLGVIGENTLVMIHCFTTLAVGVMHAGQQITCVRAEYRIGEGG